MKQQQKLERNQHNSPASQTWRPQMLKSRYTCNSVYIYNCSGELTLCFATETSKNELRLTMGQMRVTFFRFISCLLERAPGARGPRARAPWSSGPPGTCPGSSGPCGMCPSCSYGNVSLLAMSSIQWNRQIN